MSYNVTRVECLALDAKIHTRTLQRLLKRVRAHEGDGKAPSENFLAHHERVEPDADGFITLKSLTWTDDWSGYAIELFEAILTEIEGSAEIVLTWESGSSTSGYRVRDGVVEQCQVIRALGGPIKRILRGIDLPPWSPRGTDMVVTHGSPKHAVMAMVTVLPRKPGELGALLEGCVHTEGNLVEERFTTEEAAKLWCEEKLAELGFRVASPGRGRRVDGSRRRPLRRRMG